MAQSLFDWDDEEEKDNDNVAMIQYQAETADSPPEAGDHQSGNTPEPFGFPSDRSEYSPDPFERLPEPFPYTPDPYEDQPGFLPEPFEPQPLSGDESVRRGGLAYSAGIVFFSSVAFMLFLGWIADWLLGSSPWGLVGGIVLGSIIGFIQFFRITSQIFNSKKAESAMRPLMPPDDDDK
jgi:F0F1-type ATP synthase assembly protein I